MYINPNPLSVVYSYMHFPAQHFYLKVIYTVYDIIIYILIDNIIKVKQIKHL